MDSHKKYGCGDSEEDDEERCLPSARLEPVPSPPSNRVRKVDLDKNEVLQYTPDSRRNDESIGRVSNEASAKKKAPSDESHVHSLFSVPEFAMTSSGTSDEEIHLGPNNFANANVPSAAPSETSSVPARNVTLPGAFHDDGRNARDVTGDDEVSASVQTDRNALPDLDVMVSAEAVDPNETQRIVERELAKQQRKAPVAEVVQGFWCSKRVRRLSVAAAILVVAAIVLGTVLPRVLEPQDPTPAPTAAPTAALPYLTDYLSSISSDEGEALQTPSTPQNEALTWLVNNTLLGLYTIDKKVQRYVLATLFYSTNGYNWKRNSQWLSDDDECGWYTETKSSFCADSKVVDLDLYDDNTRTGNNLVGTIPNELSLLSSSLEKLNLAGNKLTGTIPSEIGALSKLNELSLWNNTFTGPLLPEIGSLTDLRSINIRANVLTGTIVSEIGLLTNLGVLSISLNNLIGTIPSEIGLLRNLNKLFLYGNKLTGMIPSELALLTNLTALSLYDNGLTGEFTCPNYIVTCRVSCDNETEQCRSLESDVFAEPSSNTPSTPEPSSNVPSPPSIVGVNPSTPAPTVVPTPGPITPTSADPVILPTLVPPTTSRPTIQTARPTASSNPRPVPTQSSTQVPSVVQTNPPTNSPTSLPTSPPSKSLDRFPLCGDGIIDPETGEECEPESPPYCPEGQYCNGGCKCVGCGNGRIDEGEECDPRAEPTGCDEDSICEDCECIFLCVEPVCGDGILVYVVEEEECEPGVPPFCPDGQSCNDECLCVGCGNGRIDGTEQCDYAAEPTGCGDSGYCASDCICEYGVETPSPTSLPVQPPPVGVPTDSSWDPRFEFCGNGVIDSGEECEPEVGPFCLDGLYCDDITCLCVGCGNGRIDEGEECDFSSEPTGCNDEATFCDYDCGCVDGRSDESCGDGIVNSWEECDPLAPPTCTDSQICSDSACICTTCGNGQVDEGEECDYAAVPTGCREEEGEYCHGSCTCTMCGNGQIDDGEMCDFSAEETGCQEDEYCSYDSDCTECVSMDILVPP